MHESMQIYGSIFVHEADLWIHICTAGRSMHPTTHLEREVQDEHRDGDEEEHDVVVQVLGGLRIG